MTDASPPADGAASRRAPTPGQLYTDAVWESKRLGPNERLVCLCYADHAHDAGRPVDRAWVTTARLMERTGMSKGAVILARNGAIDKGWLVDIGARPGHKQIRVYRLQAPDESAASSSSTTGRGRDGKGRFITKPVHEVDWSGGAPESARGADMDATSQVDGADGQTGPPEVPVHAVDTNRSMTWTGTGPRRGPDSLTEVLPDSPPDAGGGGGGVEEREEDHQGQDSVEVPNVPGVPPDLAAKVMWATTATASEFVRIVAAARQAGIRTPGPWLLSNTGDADFRQRLADLRAGGGAATPPATPIPPPLHIVLAQARRPVAPAPRDEELTDREKAIAYARSRVGASPARPGGR
ncbi:helix-turn-helix domain-containing protein [Streptosporangium sp. V21-05]|uniref:helix-turn-helix domain-containing protein n=1 Tax=Streptosporangium sp. V21-05 TaxID=3446115 RepID=UPI003F534D17